MELLTKALLDLATVSLSILIPLLAGFTVEWLRKKVGAQNIKNIQNQLYHKRDLADSAVKFVQQTFQSAYGSEKYEKAAAWLADRAQSTGLTVTPEEIEGLIEAALKDLKWQFGEAWKR